jgi:hypothetical protein
MKAWGVIYLAAVRHHTKTFSPGKNVSVLDFAHQPRPALMTRPVEEFKHFLAAKSFDPIHCKLSGIADVVGVTLFFLSFFLWRRQKKCRSFAPTYQKQSRRVKSDGQAGRQAGRQAGK